MSVNLCAAKRSSYVMTCEGSRRFKDFGSALAYGYWLVDSGEGFIVSSNLAFKKRQQR